MRLVGGMSNDIVFGAVVSGFFTLLAVFYTQYQTRKLRQEESRRESTKEASLAEIEREKIQQEAFRRAENSYETALRTQQQRGDGLEIRLSALERKQEATEERAEQAENRAEHAELELRRLKAYVDLLTNIMIHAGIQVPEQPGR